MNSEWYHFRAAAQGVVAEPCHPTRHQVATFCRSNPAQKRHQSKEAYMHNIPDYLIPADQRLLRAFGEMFININQLQTFYTTTKDLLETGKDHVEQKTIKLAKEELAKPEWQRFCSIRSLEDVPGLTDLALRAAAGRSIRISQQVIDSAALVFAHTILDGALTECCYVSFEASPSDWFGFVENRKVELAELQRDSADNLRHKKALELVKQMGRESMAKRLELLHRICVPRLNGEKPMTHWIAVEELDRFDRLRQDIIHIRGFAQAIPGVQDEVMFSMLVSTSAFVLVGKAYGLTADGLLQKENPDPEATFGKVFAGLLKDLPEIDQYLQDVTAALSLLRTCISKIQP
jgi:hypothetical protein